MTKKMRKMTAILLCALLVLGLATPAAMAAEVETASAFTTTPMVAAGFNHTVALRSDGTVWAWGWNYRGQLGDGTGGNWDDYRSTPVQVRNLNNVIAIATGPNHTVALRNDGTVWAWGWNYLGQLGDGTGGAYEDFRTIPVQVQNLNNVIAIATSSGHTVALRNDGTVWAWGWNWHGQLGDGTTTDRHTPAQVRSLNNIVAIAAGDSHTVALWNDGTVWAWGSNVDAQLGDGTTTNRHTPVQARNLNNVVGISAGREHTMAVRSDGTVWEWGVKSGETDGHFFSDTPLQNPYLSNIRAVASAFSPFSMAIQDNGTVWLWGVLFEYDWSYNWIVWHSAPGRVGEIYDATAIAAGNWNGVVLRADGSVWAWGSNEWGQLGNGTRNFSGRFVQVRGPGGVDYLNLGASTLPDWPSEWAVEQVNAAIAAGLVPQNLQSNYTAATTRAEFAALAVRLYENQRGEIRGRVTFADTNDVNVQKAAYIGVVLGVGNNRFAPNETLTREQAAVMLARLADAIGRPLPNNAPTFVDNHLIADWALAATGRVQAVGIMGGVGNNRFAPQDTYTREQSIVTIMRLFDFVR